MKDAFTTLMSILLLCALTISLRAQGTEKEKIAKATMQYLGQASAAYLEQDYKKAIQLYSKALELEKKRANARKEYVESPGR